MANLYLEIITPSKFAFKGEVVSITVPGTVGSFQILFNHAPIISSLEIGSIKIVKADNTISYCATSGGTIEVVNNKIEILADSVEFLENIDLDRAKSAFGRAKKRIEEINKQEIDIIRAEAALARAMNRISLVEKHLITP